MQKPLKPLPTGECPDPAVSLRVGWPANNGDGTYTFRLVANVINRGHAPFHSNRAQTQVQIAAGPRVLLSEVWASAAARTITLAPGAGLSAVALVERWNPTSEFLTDFVAQISYDPDIRIDGNPQNDDCVMTNNTARLSVEQVRRVLAPVRSR